MNTNLNSIVAIHTTRYSVPKWRSIENIEAVRETGRKTSKVLIESHKDNIPFGVWKVKRHCDGRDILQIGLVKE
jgi:hypothetical protein